MKNRTDYWTLALTVPGAALLVTLAIGCGVEPAQTPSASSSVPSTAHDAELPTPSQYGSVQHADESNFETLVLQAKVPVLVDFYADWCQPCRIQAPILDDFARETPDVLIVKIDVDQNPRLAAEYEISSIPSMKVFRDGQVVGQHVGVAGKDQLRALLGT